jgi:membrane protein DedA with SNARE-associated domain
VRKAPPTVRIAMSAGFVRMALLIAVPVVVAVIALLAGADIGSGKWVSAGVFLIAVSAAVTSAWLGYHWWRRQRRHAPRPAA